MSEEGKITLKNGLALEIKEWIKRREVKKSSDEYEIECRNEIRDLKRCKLKRTVKYVPTPEYKVDPSEVRLLTDEEIIKEYIMPEQEKKKVEVKSKPYRILALMKELGGRSVLTSVIANGIKQNKRNVSSILSQMKSAGILVSCSSSSNKKLFLWRIKKEASIYPVEELVKVYNEHIRSARKKSKEIFIKGVNKDIDKEVKESISIEQEEPKIETPPSEQIVRVIVEGSIKISFRISE